MEIERFVVGSSTEGDGLPGHDAPIPQLHLFIEHSPSATLFMNAAGKVLYANARFWSLFDTSFFDRSLNPLTMYHLSGFDEGLLASIRALLNGRATDFSLTSLYRMGPESTAHPLRIRGTAVRDARQTVQGAVLVFDREEEKIQAKAPSVTAHPAPPDDWLAQMQHVFIHTMSHEFRTPLGVINGYAELLRQELTELGAAMPAGLPPQIDEFTTAIHENAQKLLLLTNELFDLSNMRQLPLLPIGLHDTLRPVANQNGELLARKGVRFELELDGDEIMVRSDRKRLYQVLDILLSNAAKFTDTGIVRLATHHQGHEVEIEVTDTGIGMSTEFMDMLFTPFTQEDDRLNRTYPGAGLGLALAKLFVGLMEGRIEVVSKKGVGSTFKLVLPTA
ncbi:MAG: ATP-binding protein [Rhodothermales bacterium]|nr:ATP-binding protein [Rhodothermales bacterium]